MKTNNNSVSVNMMVINMMKGNAAMALATLTTEEEVKNAANALMMAVKEAAVERLAALTPSAPVKTTPEPAPKKDAPKGKSKKEKTTEPAAPKTTKAKATAKEREAAADKAAEELKASKKELKKLGLRFVSYKKSQLILGDTKAIKDTLAKLQIKKYGVYHFNAPAIAEAGYTGGFTWAVNNETAADVAKMLGIKYKKAQ